MPPNDPEQLKAIGGAFDGAWEQIAPDVNQRPGSIEAARLKLAEVVLGLAKDGVIDSEQLKEAALERMFDDPQRL
jgi:hypothetical protein